MAITIPSLGKMTGETPEVRSDKRKTREKKERKREKREKKMSRVDYYQSVFNSQKEKFNIGRNAQNLKKWPGSKVKHYNHKSSCRS